MLEERILETINKFNLINTKDSIVVGVSGGPDSITLLDILIKLQQKIQFSIVVAHINHMIRKEAIEDEKYVENYCKNKNINFFVKRIQVEKIAKQEKIGTEEAGRKY